MTVQQLLELLKDAPLNAEVVLDTEHNIDAELTKVDIEEDEKFPRVTLIADNY